MGKVKPERRRVLPLLLLTLLWMCVIFWFSSRNEAESVGMSGSLLERLLEIIPFRRCVSDVARKVLKTRLHFAFRKLAHFTEYAVLGSLLTGEAQLLFPKEKYSRRVRVFLRAFLPVLLSFLYAGSDEIHQLFSSGRNGNMRDVMIDTAGAAFGMLVIKAVSHLFQFIKERRKRKKAEKAKEPL